MTRARKAAELRRGDWVRCRGFLPVGLVRRMARDGSWADVDWRSWVKRMKASALIIVTEMNLGGGWKVVDVSRRDEIGGGGKRAKPRHARRG